MTSNDLRIAANVRFALLDLRHAKKPKLTDILRTVAKKMQQKISLPVIEISTGLKVLPTLAQVAALLPPPPGLTISKKPTVEQLRVVVSSYHFVVVLSETYE